MKSLFCFHSSDSPLMTELPVLMRAVAMVQGENDLQHNVAPTGLPLRGYKIHKSGPSLCFRQPGRLSGTKSSTTSDGKQMRMG
mmetsp:Transcript_6339/g.11608  ORF Transcript_6339/g.11608 Transcript_6339/m.11608 type:complete len:83 (+) Transcript_6339:94-342(+)